MDQELKQYLDGRFAEIDRKFAEQDAKFTRDLERVETASLTEFHKWASPADMRARMPLRCARSI